MATRKLLKPPTRAQEKLPSWDLKDLYDSITDLKIDNDIQELNNKAKSFDENYRDKIGKLAKTPDKLLRAIQEYEDILRGAAKPIEYASLVFAENSKDSKSGAFLQKAKAAYLSISKALIFFDLNLTKLPEATLKKLIMDKTLSNYSHFLQRLLDYKFHRLTEAEEKILSDKSLTGRGAFVRLFDQELARKQFKFKSKSKTKTLTQSELLDLFHSPDRKTRKAAADSLTAGLLEEIDRFTFITNILVEDKAINDRLAKFSYPEESRHLDNEINRQIVETMVSVIIKNYNVVQDFYEFKKKVLRLKKLEVYDVYAPVSRSTKKVSYQEAQDIVLKSFSKFSPEYEDRAQKFFDKNWIDVPPKEGKKGGAFCSYGLPGEHPYILLNYTQNLRQVLTLAHELGHGVHASLFGKNSYLNFDTPLTIAETSSVFAEMLVFDDLKEKIKNPQEKFALYVGKIEDTFATVFRQVGMYQFEQKLHDKRNKEGELTTEQISEIWQETRREMFGDSVNIDDKFSIWWSYIPHFIHTPFYVYAYAFGELLTLSLYAQYKKDPTAFTPKYLDFLKAGGSKSPEELLKPLEINLEDPNFWQDGIDAIKELVTEAKELY